MNDKISAINVQNNCALKVFIDSDFNGDSMEVPAGYTYKLKNEKPWWKWWQGESAGLRGGDQISSYKCYCSGKCHSTINLTN